MTYEARQRSPLVDSHSRTIIERRSKEVLGVVMLAASVAAAALLGTYSATDPGLFSANDSPIQNLLGETGAAIASPLMLIIGLSSWVIVVFLAVWAFRFMSHVGDERFLGRLIFLPFLIVAASIHLTSLSPHESWPHNFGVGGMFGETALSIIVYAWPTGVEQGEAVSAYLSAAVVALFAFLALGVTAEELASLPRSLSRSGRTSKDVEPAAAEHQPPARSMSGSVLGAFARLRRERDSEAATTPEPETDLGTEEFLEEFDDEPASGRGRRSWRLIGLMRRRSGTELEMLSNGCRSRVVRGVSEPPITRS